MNVLVGIAALVYTLNNIGPVGWAVLVIGTALLIALAWWLWLYLLLAALLVGAVYAVAWVMR